MDGHSHGAEMMRATAPEGLGLSWLLDPVSPAVFLRDYWEENLLHLPRNDNRDYASLLTLDQVDAMLTSADVSADVIDVTTSDGSFDRTAFTRSDGSIDVVMACQLFAKGATLILRSLHKWRPPVAALCRALEHAFSFPVTANLYMTPRGVMGLPIHYDTHDVFVLQIAGSKDWTIFDVPVRLPLQGQPFDEAVHRVGKPTKTLTLRAGDCLYVPRGFLHHAQSRDELSLQLTLGVRCYRWADVLLETIAELCLSDAAFRRALPVDLARPEFDAAAARRTFADLMRRAAETAQPDRALARLADEFIDSRLAHVPAQLTQMMSTEDLMPRDEVGARPSLIYRLEADGDGVRVRSQGRQLSLSGVTPDTVSFALDRRRYRVSDLPGDLDDQEKLDVVRRLIAEGLVVRHA
jgi:ribosomal protein L16 Arg81 hydroxylase